MATRPTRLMLTARLRLVDLVGLGLGKSISDER